MAKFITTGRTHDTAELEVRQINQIRSRKLEAVQATSQQAYSSEPGLQVFNELMHTHNFERSEPWGSGGVPPENTSSGLV
ncbi:hypothetical protein TRICI_005990 [Trichomonascus ciferrii]|uniref:Uncharacterized protein n=1 Tax=Trichomonascus ciferrii TaxID=44093 RepID=A0A642UME2_9ASCO|nr:hypothetical protein TRICI_005990 [Trichomonascus ciferrii]